MTSNSKASYLRRCNTGRGGQVRNIENVCSVDHV